jgi:hypothetical protein
LHYRDEGIAKAARQGWARALQRAVWLFEDRIVRRGIGGRTRKLVAAADLATESKNRQFANRYEATPTPLLLMWFIRSILPKDRSAWTFIDIEVLAICQVLHKTVAGITVASRINLGPLTLDEHAERSAEVHHAIRKH